MFFRRLLTVGLAVMLLYLAFPSFAYAYLDPGTGSYIFQLILAGLVGLLFAVKIYWRRITTFFTGLFSKGAKMDGDLNGESKDKNV